MRQVQINYWATDSFVSSGGGGELCNRDHVHMTSTLRGRRRRVSQNRATVREDVSFAALSAQYILKWNTNTIVWFWGLQWLGRKGYTQLPFIILPHFPDLLWWISRNRKTLSSWWLITYPLHGLACFRPFANFRRHTQCHLARPPPSGAHRSSTRPRLDFGYHSQFH